MTSAAGLNLTTLPSETGTVLVAGDGGLIGSYTARLYTQRGWEVHGVSRRDLPEADWTHHSADLLSDTHVSELATAKGLNKVTHLVFAAYIEQETDAELLEVNDTLLDNTLEILRQAGAPLQHVTLYQGGKAYGHHLGFFNTPAKESDPRLIGPHFYYTQEDLLLVIGVYAAISKELGLPLRFPGTRAAYDVLYQTTDAELLARATFWSGSAHTAANQVFNVTNGDQFRWSQLWPRFAEHFGMHYAPPQQMSLAEAMPALAEV